MSAHRILHLDLTSGLSRPQEFGDQDELLGGSHLAAALYAHFGLIDQPWDHPDQPVILAIGPLTGWFPMMSKVVCAFRSPYHGQYAESHAGGNLGLALRFAGYDALVLTGRAPRLGCPVVGSRRVEMLDVHFLRGQDCFQVGRVLRRMAPGAFGHRSILRVGPAAEHGSAFACVNVDTYRHFGRLGAGTALAVKNVKGLVVQGDGPGRALPGEDYAKVFQDVYQKITQTPLLAKYHDLGTSENIEPLNEMRALPWRNLNQTTDPGAAAIGGDNFASRYLMRHAACAGCPVGCIHVGMLRQQYAADHHYQFRQVAYDYEPIFAMGSMLGITDPEAVLTLCDQTDRLGLDVMSAGVALAWATEALAKELVGPDDVGMTLAFGQVEGYLAALDRLALGVNEFWRLLAQGTGQAVARYGGGDFACLLGQEMAGYATGPGSYISQALGFRHSHLDAGGYSLDQAKEPPGLEGALAFLEKEEHGRCLLTSLVSCLFARKVYDTPQVASCLASVGLAGAAQRAEDLAERCRRERWRLRVATGYDPTAVVIPKRFLEVDNWRGQVDPAQLEELRRAYAGLIQSWGAASQTT